MFAQHFDASRKRLREDELDVASGSCGFGEHRNKRLQLPMRTSPTSHNHVTPSFPPATVSNGFSTGNGDMGEQPRSRFSPWSSSPTFGTSSIDDTRDMDVAMDLALSPLQSSQTNETHSFRLESDDPTSRIPTPIQPTFAAQVRGSNSWAGQETSAPYFRGVANLGHVPTMFEDRAVPRTMTMQINDNWPSAIHRRIPSPISEGDSQGGTASPGMCLDNGSGNSNGSSGVLPGQLTARLEQSSLSAQAEATMVGAAAASTHEHSDPLDGMPPLAETTSAPATPSPGRTKGHIRSRHTLQAWTAQPGMKKSFSIGYRADCEKCRLKVPGHFNHIIIS